MNGVSNHAPNPSAWEIGRMKKVEFTYTQAQVDKEIDFAVAAAVERTKQQRSQDLQESRAENSYLRAENDTLQETTKAIETQFSKIKGLVTARDQTQAALEAENKSLKAEVSVLKEKCDAHRQEKITLRAEVDKISGLMEKRDQAQAALEAENKSLKSANTLLQQRCDAEVDERRAIEGQVLLVKASIQNRDNKHQRLTAENRKLKECCTQLILELLFAPLQRRLEVEFEQLAFTEKQQFDRLFRALEKQKHEHLQLQPGNMHGVTPLQ